MTSKRRPLYLLTGLILGISIGILIAWVMAPLQYVDTLPSSLRVDYKDSYRYLIASAFAANNDPLRAQSRLALLNDTEPLNAIEEQLQRMRTGNNSADQIQVLSRFATVVKAHPISSSTPTEQFTPTLTNTPTSTASSTASSSPTQSPTASPTHTPYKSPTITPSKSPTFTPRKNPSSTPSPTQEAESTSTPEPKPIVTIAARPTQTTTPTPGKPYKLSKQSTFCEQTQSGLIKIFLTDGDGKPVPGVELAIAWLDGQELFFTGLKPELGYGYADYVMAENIEYTLSLSNGNTRVTGLRSAQCTSKDGKKYPGGIKLEFSLH